MPNKANTKNQGEGPKRPVRVDNDTYRTIRANAKPFETMGGCLRRLLGLDGHKGPCNVVEK